MKHHNAESTRIVSQRGEATGKVAAGKVSLHATKDLMPTSVPTYLKTGCLQVDAKSLHIEQTARDDKKFREMCEVHDKFIKHEMKTIRAYWLRVLCNMPGTHKMTWHVLMHAAKWQVEDRFIAIAREWRLNQPDVPFDYNNASGSLVNQQLYYLAARVGYHDPVPANTSPADATILRRKHLMAAMIRQRRLLSAWSAEVGKMASFPRGGVRYRREKDCILDAWTGKDETYQQFNERMRNEGIDHVAEMIPLAAQVPEIFKQAQAGRSEPLSLTQGSEAGPAHI